MFFSYMGCWRGWGCEYKTPQGRHGGLPLRREGEQNIMGEVIVKENKEIKNIRNYWEVSELADLLLFRDEQAERGRKFRKEYFGSWKLFDDFNDDKS